jgi:hypothetical protein
MPTFLTSLIAWNACRITSSAFFSVVSCASLASSSFCLISSTFDSNSLNLSFVLLSGDFSSLSVFRSGSDLAIEFLP